jgi:glycosyltransferase involved in cell wall biosynthesis
VSGLTAIVPTFNEEENVRDCLAGLAFADEILVVDSGSTDRTREIAAALPKVRVLEHEYLGNGPQCNWAMDRASYPWVLIVDADERVPAELAGEIGRVIASEPSSDRFLLRRENVFLGRPVRHSGWGTDRLVRLVRRGSARYPERRVHSDIEAPPGTPTLRSALKHHTARSLPAYMEKLHRYAAWGAEDLRAAGRRAGIATVAGRTVWRFLRTYFVQGGFLDGRTGLLVCSLQAWGTLLKWARLWECRRLEKTL